MLKWGILLRIQEFFFFENELRDVQDNTIEVAKNQRKINIFPMGNMYKEISIVLIVSFPFGNFHILWNVENFHFSNWLRFKLIFIKKLRIHMKSFYFSPTQNLNKQLSMYISYRATIRNYNIRLQVF